MGFRINTNIAAMNSHRNAVQTNAGLDKSLASLSSGLRINTAADDASGMTIADSLRSQAQGLGQAINNANDGVAVVQTADGALDEYINIINTVRTKSIQAASDGQNTDSRAAIQRDIDRLLEAADGIANQTQFNGQKLLDGTFTNKAFHIGAYASETVNLSVGSVQTDSVGGVTSFTGAATRDPLVTTTDLTDNGAGYELAAEALTINGTDISPSLNTLSPTRLTDAASVAAAITDATGLVTDATNVMVAADAITAGTLDSSNQLKINGVAIADTTVLADDSDGALVRAINDISDQSGVTAALTANNKLELTSVDGSNISITGQANTAQTDVMTFTTTNAAGAIAADNEWNIVVAGTTVDYTLVVGDETLETAMTNFVAAINANDTIAAIGTASFATGTGDLTFTASDTETPGAPTVTAGVVANTGTAPTVTAVTTTASTTVGASDTVTGLTNDNLTNLDGTAVVTTLTASAAGEVVIAEGDLVINGVDMAGTYGDGSTAGGARADLQTAIQAISGLEDSTIDTAGKIKLIANDGQDLNISGVTATATYKLAEGVTNDSAAGKVEIFSDSSIAIAGSNEAAFGLTEGTSKVKDNGSSLESIDVTNRNSAEIAILIADSALKQLDATRSDLGSVQNQLESTIRNISVTQVNVSAAESQIRDVDFAAESANFAKLNILAQSGSYAMSQANAVQQNVMRLLQ